MAHINLLPWRDAYRQEKKKQFYLTLTVVAIVAALVGFGWVSLFKVSIDHQEARNTLFKEEIARLDKAVEQIKDIEAKKESALERLNLIQGLQYKRPLIVRYFAELVRAVPKGIFIEEMKREGNTLSITGITDSKGRVADFMRRLDKSDWLDDPNLKYIQDEDKYGSQSFQMTIKLFEPEQSTTKEAS